MMRGDGKELVTGCLPLEAAGTEGASVGRGAGGWGRRGPQQQGPHLLVACSSSQKVWTESRGSFPYSLPPTPVTTLCPNHTPHHP